MNRIRIGLIAIVSLAPVALVHAQNSGMWQLSSRLEVFAEKASGEALARTLGGTVLPGEIKPVPPAR